MESKEEIVKNWLPRYTGTPIEEFGDYILLTNFINYVESFADRFAVRIYGKDKPMQTATANGITIINFGMGSAMAATVMDLLSAIMPKAVLFSANAEV
jgi:AMP nucleosidase